MLHFIGLLCMGGSGGEGGKATLRWACKLLCCLLAFKCQLPHRCYANQSLLFYQRPTRNKTFFFTLHTPLQHPVNAPLLPCINTHKKVTLLFQCQQEKNITVVTDAQP